MFALGAFVLTSAGMLLFGVRKSTAPRLRIEGRLSCSTDSPIDETRDETRDQQYFKKLEDLIISQGKTRITLKTTWPTKNHFDSFQTAITPIMKDSPIPIQIIWINDAL